MRARAGRGRLRAGGRARRSDGAALAAFFAATHPGARPGARSSMQPDARASHGRPTTRWGEERGLPGGTRGYGSAMGIDRVGAGVGGDGPLAGARRRVRRVVREVHATRRVARVRASRSKTCGTRSTCASILGSVQAPTLVLAIPGADEQFEPWALEQERLRRRADPRREVRRAAGEGSRHHRHDPRRAPRRDRSGSSTR